MIKEITIDEFGSFHAETDENGEINFTVKDSTFNTHDCVLTKADCLISVCKYLLDEAMHVKQRAIDSLEEPVWQPFEKSSS